MTANNTLRTTIDIPTTRLCNINQFHSSVTKTINSISGCSICCGLDVANIYGPSSYSISDMAKFWGDIGYSFQLPPSCPAKISGYSATNLADNERFTIIRKEINNNRPVIIRLVGNDATTHFVVAYGYTGDGSSTAAIKVLDPSRSRKDTTILSGRDTTLDNAISWNKKIKINGLRLVTGAR